MTGLKLFHITSSSISSSTSSNFGSPSFVELRENLDRHLHQACRSQLPGLIFTFAPETTVRPIFVQRARKQ